MVTGMVFIICLCVGVCVGSLVGVWLATRQSIRDLKKITKR